MPTTGARGEPVVASRPDADRAAAWLVTTKDAVGYGDLHIDVTVRWPRRRCGTDSGHYLYRVTSLPPLPVS